jgi:hypothetical protein
MVRVLLVLFGLERSFHLERDQSAWGIRPVQTEAIGKARNPSIAYSKQTGRTDQGLKALFPYCASPLPTERVTDVISEHEVSRAGNHEAFHSIGCTGSGVVSSLIARPQ